MWKCVALFLFVLALWTEPAGAQDGFITHTLTVSVHPAVSPKLTQGEIEDILKGASDLLQGHTDIKPPNNCMVEFKFDRFITFPLSAPAKIKTADDLEMVHRVPADIKIVQSIEYCVQRKGLFWGCAWRAGDRQRTVIISRQGISAVGGPIEFAHEYGHTTGLPHRRQAGDLDLMAPCLAAFSQQVNQDECAHFLKGPVPPPYSPTLGPACPKVLTGHLPD